MSRLMDDAILKLKVISKLADYEHGRYKLNVQSGNPIIERVTLASSFFRYFSGESRYKTIFYVNKIYFECEQLVALYIDSKSLDFEKILSLQEVGAELEASIPGLEKLKLTYTADSTVSARIDILKARVWRLVSKIEECVQNFASKDKDVVQRLRNDLRRRSDPDAETLQNRCAE